MPKIVRGLGILAGLGLIFALLWLAGPAEDPPANPEPVSIHEFDREPKDDLTITAPEPPTSPDEEEKDHAAKLGLDLSRVHTVTMESE